MPLKAAHGASPYADTKFTIVPNFSAIGQSAAELQYCNLTTSTLRTVRHLGFVWKGILLQFCGMRRHTMQQHIKF